MLAPVALLAVGCGEGRGDGARLDPPGSHTSPGVISRAGLLVFRDNQALGDTIAQLTALDAAGRRAWNQQMGIVSLRQVFDDVVAAETAIDDHYEQLANDPATAALVPKAPVHSSQYDQALRNGQLRIVNDGDGDYFYYNVKNTYLTPVLDASGRIALGDVVFQYGPSGVKQVGFAGLGDVDRALANLATAPVQPNAGYAIDVPVVAARRDVPSDDCVCLPNTDASWMFSSVTGNGWSTHGNRRYRAWVEGESHKLEDSSGRPQLTVRNVLRIQGQKKNIFGSWGFRETYVASADLNWGWFYFFDEFFTEDLPVPAGSPASPMSWSFDFVNDATIPMAPHIDGFYQFNCVDCTVEPVIVTSVGGTALINGVEVNPTGFRNASCSPGSCPF